jgi:UDP-N-acetylglucosamine 4,6-dehydratase/5-epimerase
VADFSGKCLLITGGTGSFGQKVLQRFLGTNISEVRIFSRDEAKQDSLRHRFSDPRINCVIGDVRHYDAIGDAVRGVDFVFHAAALKQVPSCEFNPVEAVRTNVLGTDNVLRASFDALCEKVICLSTDKAVMPVNAMGMTKALMEKIASASVGNPRNTNTTVCSTRYGNVIASRGSVIPLFFDQIRKELPLSITVPEMTRFLMTLEEAVDLVMYTFEHGRNGDIFIKKSPSARIDVIAEAVCALLDVANYPVKIIGARHGEKLHETLLSGEEHSKAEDLGGYFRLPGDFRGLGYSEADVADRVSSLDLTNEYSSGAQNLLGKDEVVTLINSSNLEI